MTTSSASSGTTRIPTTIFASAFGSSRRAARLAAPRACRCRKIVGGVVTQLFPAVRWPRPSPITQAMIDNRTPFDLRVAVNGTNYEVFFNNTSLASGTDAALASGRKVGVQSWAQQSDAAAVTPFWGTEAGVDLRHARRQHAVQRNVCGPAGVVPAARDDQRRRSVNTHHRGPRRSW